MEIIQFIRSLWVVSQAEEQQKSLLIFYNQTSWTNP